MRRQALAAHRLDPARRCRAVGLAVTVGVDASTDAVDAVVEAPYTVPKSPQLTARKHCSSVTSRRRTSTRGAGSAVRTVVAAPAGRPVVAPTMASGPWRRSRSGRQLRGRGAVAAGGRGPRRKGPRKRASGAPPAPQPDPLDELPSTALILYGGPSRRRALRAVAAERGHAWCTPDSRGRPLTGGRLSGSLNSWTRWGALDAAGTSADGWRRGVVPYRHAQDGVGHADRKVERSR